LVLIFSPQYLHHGVRRQLKTERHSLPFSFCLPSFRSDSISRGHIGAACSFDAVVDSFVVGVHQTSLCLEWLLYVLTHAWLAVNGRSGNCKPKPNAKWPETAGLELVGMKALQEGGRERLRSGDEKSFIMATCLF
jgi:hypothetical protein